MLLMIFFFVAEFLIINDALNSENCEYNQVPCDKNCLDLFRPEKSRSTYFEQQFNQTIKCLRFHFKEGNGEGVLPALDPFRINGTFPVKVALPNLLYTDLQLSNFVTHGLTNFDTVTLNLSPLLQLDANFHFDKIHLHTSYGGNWNILGLMAFYGEGSCDMEFMNVNIKTSTLYSMTPRLIQDFTFRANVKNFNITITNIMNDEELSKIFSSWLSKYLGLFINIYQKQIAQIIEPYIIKVMDDHFGHLSFLEFLEKITDSNCN